ncbi:MAG: transposase [Nitrososphaerota archaeon]|nr:transposase [Nitrososphaerota archaeon]
MCLRRRVCTRFRTPFFDEEKVRRPRGEEEEAGEQVHRDGQGCLQGLQEAGGPALLQQVLQEGLRPLAAHRPPRPDAEGEEVVQGVRPGLPHDHREAARRPRPLQAASLHDHREVRPQGPFDPFGEGDGRVRLPHEDKGAGLQPRLLRPLPRPRLPLLRPQDQEGHTDVDEETGQAEGEEREEMKTRTRRFLKLTIGVELKTQLVTAVKLRRGPANDNRDFEPVVRKAQAVKPIKIGIGDKGYDDEDNHELLRDELGAMSIIPARYQDVPVWRTRGRYRKEMKRGYSKKTYHQRSKDETVFSVVKRTMGDEVRSVRTKAQNNEVRFRVMA